jgi:hypothetical protein
MLMLKKNIKTLLVVFGVLTFPSLSYAQVPTFDPTNIANIVTRVENLSNQIKQIQRAAKQVEKTKSTIGDSVSNVGGQWKNMRSGSDFKKSVADLKNMKPNVPKDFANIGFNENMIEKPAATKKFLKEKVVEKDASEEGDKPQTVEDLAEKRKAKDAMLKEAATSAYATSLNVRNSSSQVDTKMEAVQEAAENATTERDDLAALTQATVIMVEDLATLNTMTASGLEMSAATAINGL